MISPSLRMQVVKHMFMKVYKSNNTGLVNFISRYLQVRIFMPEAQIISEGDQGDTLYFLSKGDCEVLIKDERKRDQLARYLTSGAVFGEISLIYRCKRTATVRTKNYCQTTCISRYEFFTLGQSYPEFYQKLKSNVRKLYVDKNKNFLYTLIRQVDYLQNLSMDTVEELCYSVKKEYIDVGSDLFRANDLTDQIYFIIDGQVDMYLNINMHDVHIETLYKGCIIGQNGILDNAFSQFVGKTSAPTSVYVLEKSTLDHLRKELRDLDDAMSEATRKVKQSGIGLVDFRLYRMGKVKPIDIFKKAIRRAVMINRRLKEDMNNPTLLQVLKDLQTKQRAGVSFSEDDVTQPGQENTEINKEMFAKLINMIDVIQKDNFEKKNEIQKLETRIEKLTDADLSHLQSMNGQFPRENSKSLNRSIDQIIDEVMSKVDGEDNSK